MSEKKSFSATEVGVLIEEFKSGLALIAERVGTVCDDMGEVKERLSNLETETRGLKDAVRLFGPRITRLESKIV